MLGWSEKTAEMTDSREKKRSLEKLLFCCARKRQTDTEKPVGLDHNEDLETRQQWVKSSKHVPEAFSKGHLHNFDDL